MSKETDFFEIGDRNVDGIDMAPCPTLPSEFKLRRRSFGLHTLGRRAGSFLPR